MNTLQSKINPTHNYTLRRGKSKMQKGSRASNRKYSHTETTVTIVPVEFLYHSVKGDSAFIKLPNGLTKLVPNTSLTEIVKA